MRFKHIRSIGFSLSLSTRVFFMLPIARYCLRMVSLTYSLVLIFLLTICKYFHSISQRLICYFDLISKLGHFILPFLNI